jgi:flagellar biosynthesis protein FlhB
MSEQAGEKTEQPSQKKIEEAQKKGQFARSAEIQTVAVLFAGMIGLVFVGSEIWRHLLFSAASTLGHLHEIPVTLNAMQGYVGGAAWMLIQVLWPLLGVIIIGSLLAGGIQTRFRTAPEAVGAHWEKVDPVKGFKRVFSLRSAVPALLGILKLSFIGLLTYGVVLRVMNDPIFYSIVDVARIAEFLADSSFRIVIRIALALLVIAALDYAYQCWRTNRDMMMTRQEVKDETKNTEGNPQVKAQQRRKRLTWTQRRMLSEVPKADVVVTNPTHLAIALRYDRRTMSAPKIVAKGSRLNAARIRAIAEQHQVPILENKPLARLMFKHGRVGGEIPAQLYAAVAEVLAWVYRVNAYRYYREQHS